MAWRGLVEVGIRFVLAQGCFGVGTEDGGSNDLVLNQKQTNKHLDTTINEYILFLDTMQ